MIDVMPMLRNLGRIAPRARAGASPTRCMRAPVCLVCLVSWLTACQTELQHDLTESEANDIVVLLQSHGVAAEKSRGGPAGDWVVRVPQGEVATAWQVLQANGLPRRQVDGVSETLEQGGLIPSPTEARARLARAQAGELERSLLALESVVDARVHLVAAGDSRALARVHTDPTPARAAVLLIVQSDAPPATHLAVADVQRLVAGGVADLDPERVDVVISRRAAGELPDRESLVGVGPFLVSQSSQRSLQVVLAIGATLIVALSGALVALLWRRRRHADTRGAA